MNRRRFINNALIAGAAFSLLKAGLDILPDRPETTIIGIGGSGIGLLGKAKNEFGNNISYLGIDTKGEWNTSQHHLIGFDYRRPVDYYLPKHAVVAFAKDDESIAQDWIDNYHMLEPAFETRGKVIVIASLSKTMGGMVGHKIIREIIKRKKADVTYLAIGPFSFEGKKAGMEQEYSRVYVTGSLCSRFEILSNKELLKPFNGYLDESLERVDQKIMQRIGQLI